MPQISPADDFLLNMGNLPGRNLHSQVASGHHDPVGLLDDPVDIVYAFLTLYLGDDINMIPAVCLKQLTDFFDSLCVSHKRSRDKIHALLDSKQNILHILLRDIGKADAGIRYVDRKSTRLNSSHVSISYAV